MLLDYIIEWVISGFPLISYFQPWFIGSKKYQPTVVQSPPSQFFPYICHVILWYFFSEAFSFLSTNSKLLRMCDSHKFIFTGTKHAYARRHHLLMKYTLSIQRSLCNIVFFLLVAYVQCHKLLIKMAIWISCLAAQMLKRKLSRASIFSVSNQAYNLKKNAASQSVKMKHSLSGFHSLSLRDCCVHLWAIGILRVTFSLSKIILTTGCT